MLEFIDSDIYHSLRRMWSSPDTYATVRSVEIYRPSKAYHIFRIVFCTLQGIGGSGAMSMSFVIVAEMVPATKYAMYGSITSFAFAIVYLLGPMLGGLINEHTTWRWIFLLKYACFRGSHDGY